VTLSFGGDARSLPPHHKSVEATGSNQRGVDSNCLPGVEAGRHVEGTFAGSASSASHREAVERFGVSVASVSRWRNLERQRGDARLKALGGDRRSGRIEAHKETILAVLKATPDLAIEELRRRLAEKGLVFGEGTIRRFLDRYGITRKKRRRTPANRTLTRSRHMTVRLQMRLVPWF
jgi:transposase